MTVKIPEAARGLDPEAILVEVGKVGRPHGLDGRVRVHQFNPQSEIWHEGRTLRARLPGKPVFLLEIIELKHMNVGTVVRFAGFDDRTSATALTHAILSVAQSDLPEPQADEFYLHEIVGAEVLDAATQARVGVVSGILETNIELIEVRLDAGGTALLPVVSEAIESLGRIKGQVVVRDIEDWRSE